MIIARWIGLDGGPCHGQAVRLDPGRGGHEPLVIYVCEPDPGRMDWPEYHPYVRVGDGSMAVYVYEEERHG